MLYFVTDSALDKLNKILEYLDDKFDKESVADVLSEYIYLLSLDINFNNSKIYEIINLIFDKCIELAEDTSVVKMMMYYLIRYHHLLNNLIQKYIANCFWDTESDKEYIEAYCKLIMQIPAKKKYHNKQENIQQIKRIVFNAPVGIKKSLATYSLFLVLCGEFNTMYQ